MKTVWKYLLEITDRQEILMPYNAEILTIQEQHNILCLWAVLNTAPDPIFGEEKEKRIIEIIGTGNLIPELAIHETKRKYINTCIMEPFVWHVFEIKLI